MKKGLTEIVFLLDRSGSMSGLESDTIGGFHSMIEKQKKEEGEMLVSVVLFDDRSEVIYDRVDIGKIETMNDSQYYVRGCTALLDAIGDSINHIKKVRKDMEKEKRPEKTIFIITTDGMENSSREYSYDRVKNMIENCQENDWEFIFLGANIDAAAEASRMGISKGRAVTYTCDSVGTALNFKVLGSVVSRMRSCKSSKDMGKVFEEDCFEEIKKDHKKRG